MAENDSMSSVCSVAFSYWEWSVSVDYDSSYLDLSANFGTFLNKGSLFVGEDNIAAVPKLWHYFSGVTIIDEF